MKPWVPPLLVALMLPRLLDIPLGGPVWLRIYSGDLKLVVPRQTVFVHLSHAQGAIITIRIRF